MSAAAPLDPALLSDEALLDLVQRRTLRHFWEKAHPVSGMARERDAGAYGYSAEATVTTGGTGFGLMALIVSAERGWLPRGAVIARLNRIVGFLAAADRFHGVFPHFMDGETGRTIPFSEKDDGADLVETSFLIAGLLAVREWLRNEDPALVAAIDAIWRAVEWDHHLRDDGALLWHWSPRYGTAMNHAITGWNECLITHVLAAASPTHPVPADTYHRSWAKGADFLNGAEQGGIRLALGPEKGGPLFFTHYSFLGLDPRGLSDAYADYFEQNRAHVLANHAHCVANPFGHAGYGADCWGLTASDNDTGYSAHSPTNDLGIISPTAALASMPYAPDLALAAARRFMTVLDGRVFGPDGFADAFAPGRNWVAESHLAIDQGPIVVMIENHRSGLLWRLFMAAPEIRGGLARLGFNAPALRPDATA